MADQHSLPSPTNQTTPIPLLFGSPRFFNGSFRKGTSSIFDSETMMSPTSILDSKKVSTLISPFGYDQNLSKPQNSSSQENKHSPEKGLGLALVDSLNDDKNPENFNFIKPKLKIQIPTLPLSVCSPTLSPKSPADFGIKTPNRNSPFLGSKSSFKGLNSIVQASDSLNSPTAALTLSEMELSEDYTCVISHGPNPRTVRIYDNCVVESCNGVAGMTDLKKESSLESPSQSFLNLCPSCKKDLGDGKDRDEDALSSNKCLCHEMILSEVKNKEMNSGM
ncbi:hypothetical protein ACET3Z_019269 [Daucus carota]